jgi:hypothetical protein
MQYIKKPVAIEAIQWTGENLLEIARFTGQSSSHMCMKWGENEQIVSDQGLKIFTLEGSYMATIGDFIIKGIKGEYYPCKPDIFKKTYYTQKEFAELQDR